MEEQTRADIRSLLKTFGVRADEAIVSHLARNPFSGALHVRVILEDLTEYGDAPPDERLYFVVEGEIRTGSVA